MDCSTNGAERRSRTSLPRYYVCKTNSEVNSKPDVGRSCGCNDFRYRNGSKDDATADSGGIRTVDRKIIGDASCPNSRKYRLGIEPSRICGNRGFGLSQTS